MYNNIPFILVVLTYRVCVCWFVCVTCVLVEAEQLSLQRLTGPLSQKNGGGHLRV